MRLLFDTHAFLWFVLGDSQLSPDALSAILDDTHEKFVSPASYWEIAIKISLGKYNLATPYDEFFQKGIFDNGFDVLPIEINHTTILTTLPFHHRDPFDHLLIAQALAEGMTLISRDGQLDAYGVPRLW